MHISKFINDKTLLSNEKQKNTEPIPTFLHD